MKPIRIQRKRTKGWKMPPNSLYVGRPSKWGNPFRVVEMWDHTWSIKTDGSEECAEILTTYGHATYLTKQLAMQDAVALYSYWLMPYKHGDNMSKFYISLDAALDAINELKGKNLVCWCKDGDPCHADVLLKIANQ